MRFFNVPVLDGDEAAEEVNRFLGAHRIVAIDRQFIHDGANSAWALCITYLQPSTRPPPGRRGKIDYREVLSEPDFAVFARLRALRKTLADREGVPAYALFTNEQLAEMVQRRVRTAAALREIEGVGEARVEKYGKEFLTILQADGPAEASDGKTV
ncbi:MAG: HRDC domain-containing protein [Rhodospirillales bacterium]|nr:HRDC domain-containing protein [Rhodospirillales bacterium]